MIKIGNKIIGPNKPVFIIAEAGVNHNGRLDWALKLVDAAADAGADAVKFQTFKAEQVTTVTGKMAEYQKRNLGKTESQLEMLKKIEMLESFYKPILARCKKRGIIFLSTPHGHIESANFLQNLGVKAFKFGSGDLTNRPLLEKAACFKKPMILGTGMATMKEVVEAVQWIKKAGNNQIVMLHCTTNYPCPPEEVNLRAMQSMMKKLKNVIVGYSDHTLGYQVSLMAVTLGASVIEKHLTLDNNLPGPDHKASANPKDLAEMVRAIRGASVIMGRPIKKPSGSEKENIKVVRKSIVTLSDIKRGERFSDQNIGIKRPGTGLAPKYFFKILGKKARKDISIETLLKKNDF